jgi:uncharacterized protein YkwD
MKNSTTRQISFPQKGTFPMPHSGRRCLRVFVFVLLGIIVIPGAKCNNKPATENTCGPSSSIQPIAGAGVSWSYGSFPYSPGLFAGDLFDQINLYRFSRGLRTLLWHDGMALVAQKHAVDMNTRKYLSLVSPEGIDMCERMVSSSPSIDFDMAYQFVSFEQFPTQVFSELVNSNSARAVMEDHDVSHFGASFQANPGPFYVAILMAKNARP